MIGLANVEISWLAFAQIGIVYEVEVGLPSSSVIFDVVCKSRTLNKGMVSLPCSQAFIVSLQVAKHGES